MNRSQKVLERIARKIILRFPLPVFERLIISTISQKADSLDPTTALRFLLKLDAYLYELHGKYAVSYGNGTHVKHRLTNYHAFFVSNISGSQRVLDVGCGIGAVAYSVATGTQAEVVGVDINEQNIAFARKTYAHPQIKYVVGDALSIDWKPHGIFETVILSNVLEHLPDRSQFLRKLADATQAPYFLIRVPVFERDWRVPLKRELGIDWRLDPTHETEYTLESFQEEVDSARMSIAHQEVRWGEIWAKLKS